MPFPVQFIGQEPKSKLHFLMEGLAKQASNERQSAQLGKALGGKDLSPSQQILQILTTPMDANTRQQALQGFQLKQNALSAERQRQSTVLSPQQKATVLSPQQKAQIIQNIPQNSDPRQILTELMKSGISQKEALEITKQFSGGRADEINLNQRISNTRQRMQQRINLEKLKLDPKLDPLGMPVISVNGETVPDFSGTKGKVAIKNIEAILSQFEKDVKAEYKRLGVPLPSDIERQIEAEKQAAKQSLIQTIDAPAVDRPSLNSIFGG